MVQGRRRPLGSGDVAELEEYCQRELYCNV